MLLIKCRVSVHVRCFYTIVIITMVILGVTRMMKMMKVTLTLSVCLFPERLKLRLPDDRRRESADLCKDRIPQGVSSSSSASSSSVISSSSAFQEFKKNSHIEKYFHQKERK